MMNNRFAGEKLKYLKMMADSGLMLNCQIVCCPGINDGEELVRTLKDLYALMPNIQSAAVVPVGVTKYRKDLYPPEHMEKIAQLFEVPVERLLDDYNLFLRNGQGKQIKAIRMKLGLTQREYADRLGISLCNLKQWEQNRKQLFKSTWEKYFK